MKNKRTKAEREYLKRFNAAMTIPAPYPDTRARPFWQKPKKTALTAVPGDII